MFSPNAARSPVNETTTSQFRSKPSWTPERVAQLKEMWGDYTAREIAGTLETTKGAVIGKLDRLGLLTKRKEISPEIIRKRYERKLARAREWQKENRERRRVTQREWRIKNHDRVREMQRGYERRYYERHRYEIIERKRALYLGKIKSDRAHRIYDLRILPQDTPDNMRISIADIGQDQCRWPYEGQMFCGKPTKDNRSYCPHHHGRAYL